MRDESHDVTAVAEVMPQADEEEILARAVSEGRIVVTNDKDFGEFVYRFLGRLNTQRMIAEYLQ